MNNIDEQKEKELSLKEYFKLNAGWLVPLLIVLSLVSYVIYYVVFKETVIDKYTSPNGEHTLIVSRKDSSFLNQSYIIKSADGTEAKAATKPVTIDEHEPSIVWYNDDEACITFPKARQGDRVFYAAPNTFRVGPYVCGPFEPYN